MTLTFRTCPRLMLGFFAAVALTAASAVFVPAQARVFVGVGFGFPFFGAPLYYPPPVYYPPPAYYPPPVYYAPPVTYAPPSYSPGQQSSAGQMCYAPSYSCPMDRPVASGAACYCLGNGGQRVWGRAN